MHTVFSLIDINNFYASCERIFRPDLRRKPIVVLSSNDGCVIARSHEAKALGIPMGVPFFKIKDQIRFYDIQVFSSNFRLYSDISRRFFEVVSSLSEEVEMYSIDEIFLKLPLNKEDFNTFGCTIKKTISQCLGLPASLGFSYTKTLAKVANYWAKKDPSYEGVCVLLKQEDIFKALEKLPIESVWGIGRRLAPKLRRLGINYAKDLAEADPKWMRKMHSVSLEQVARELRGTPCLDLEDAPSTPKSIQVSRSFGSSVKEIQDIESALSSFLERGASKLRKQNLFTFGVHVYLGAKEKVPGKLSFASTFIPFPQGVQDPRVMISAVLKNIPSLFKKGLSYKKAGILLTDLGYPRQLFLLDPQNSDILDSKPLLNTIDAICKKHGSEALFLASSLSSKWQPKRDNLSPSYTTKWTDLPVAFAR